jgi:hypothetical protein
MMLEVLPVALLSPLHLPFSREHRQVVRAFAWI